MTFLRLACACLLMGASVFLARLKAGKLSMRAKALGDFLSFVRQLEALIRVGARPIPEALMESANRLGACWTGRFAEALAGLYGGRQPSSGIWDLALAGTAKDSDEAAALSKEDRSIISLFGDQLASSDMKSISENYAFLYGRIGDNLQAADHDKAVKGRLYNTVGMLAGLAAAIIVI